MEKKLIENVNIVDDWLGRLIVSLNENLFDELLEEGWEVRQRDEQTHLLWVYRYILRESIEVPKNPVNLVIVRNSIVSRAYLESAEKPNPS